MFYHRRIPFGRRTRRQVGRVLVLVALAVLGALAGRAMQDQLAPRLAFSSSMTAYAADPASQATEASVTAKVIRDLPVLEDMWGVGGGPGLRVHYVEPPEGVRAGTPLHVTVHGSRLDGSPFSGALVELSWKLGTARYRDVTFTDARGNVDVSRDVDRACKGKPCYVAVRMSRDQLGAFAYTTFVPR